MLAQKLVAFLCIWVWIYKAEDQYFLPNHILSLSFPGMYQKALYIAHCWTFSHLSTIFHARTKHIDVQYHFVQQTVEDGLIVLQKIHTKKNITYILMKLVVRKKFA